MDLLIKVDSEPLCFLMTYKYFLICGEQIEEDGLRRGNPRSPVCEANALALTSQHYIFMIREINLTH